MDLTNQSHTLDPALKAFGARRMDAIRLLIKDKHWLILHFHFHKQTDQNMKFFGLIMIPDFEISTFHGNSSNNRYLCVDSSHGYRVVIKEV